MPEITFDESCRQIRAITDRVQEQEKTKDRAAALAAMHELLDHPCAHHQVAAYEVWDDIYELHKRAGNYDAAIAAKQEAIRAGYRSEPDPEADIAECHLLAGRRADADALFADLRARTPDDVWLYNSAGFSYAEVSDHRHSARWFREGIDVALRTGDPDQVVVQLHGGLQDAWAALGESPEPGLNDRVDAFVEAWKRPSDRARHRWDDLPTLEERRCEHCGYEPGSVKGSLANWRADRHDATGRPSPGRPQAGATSSMVVSLAWFPRGEWEKATATWPDLLDYLPGDHAQYSHELEAQLKRYGRAVPGQPIRVSPMTVDGLTEYCAQKGDVPGTGEARAAYAAEIARIGDAAAWPPGRNAPCWCGSGRKYKTCCGPIPRAPE